MKEAYYSLLTQATQMLGGLIILKLLTVNLESNLFGKYILILSFSGIILTFPFTAIQQGVTKYSAVASCKQSKNIFKAVFLLSSVLFSVYLSILVFINLLDIIEMGLILQVIIALYILSEVYKVNNYSFINALRERKKYFYSVLLEFGLKISLLLLYSSDVNSILIIFIFANIVSTVSSYPRKILFSKISNKYFFYWLKMFFVFSFPLVIWGVFGWMRDMSNRWVIDYYLTLNDVALFSVVNSLAVIIPGALQMWFGMYFMPILYQKEKLNAGSIRAFNRNIFKIGVIVICLGAFFLNLLSEGLIELFSSEKYLSGSWMLTPMFVAFSLFSLSMSLTSEIFAYNKTKLLIWPNIASGIISIISYILLIQNFALKGALYAFVLTYLSYSLLTIIQIKKFERESC